MKPKYTEYDKKIRYVELSNREIKIITLLMRIGYDNLKENIYFNKTDLKHLIIRIKNTDDSDMET